MRTIFSICLFGASLFFVAFSLLVRSIPAFARLLGNVTRFLLKWSYIAYKQLLTQLDPIVQQKTGIHIMENPGRIIICCVLSLSVGCLVFLILRVRLSLILILLFIAHGTVVSLLWKDFFEPSGLHIGEKLS